jgi:hypothetical protein
MAYRTKYNGRRYYYKTIRLSDGKFMNVYVGNGPKAEGLAEQVESRRASRLALLALQERLSQTEQHIIAFSNAPHSIYVAYKYSLGFYIHKCQWRKRGKAMHLPLSVVDEKCVERVRELGKFYKQLVETEDEDTIRNRYYSTLAAKTLDCMLRSMDLDVLVDQSYRFQYARIRSKLLDGRPPCIVESITASRIALDYLDVHYHDQL